MADIGRPSSYKPEYAEQAAKLCALGATDVEIADFFGIHVTTFYRWRNEFPDFCQSIKNAKDECDIRVERRLYERALGYTHPAVKIMNTENGIEKIEYREHYPPEVAACIFWLKNRQPGKWRDRVEHTGADGGPMLVSWLDQPPKGS